MILFTTDKSLSIHNESEILIEPKDNILKENEVMEDDNDEKITEECIVLKPWRANMKRQKTIDESNEIEVEPSPAKKDGKPWRANMKKSTEQTENEGAYLLYSYVKAILFMIVCAPFSNQTT